MVCSVCAADVPEEDLFCENCGTRLAPPAAATASHAFPPSCSCGASGQEVDEDGFCLCCGRRVQRPASDHVEQQLAIHFAGVSDRGQQYDRNEDRFALVQGPAGYAMVVCDGVSTTHQSEVASAIVSSEVARELEAALAPGTSMHTEDVMGEAIRAAASVLQAQAGSGANGEAPSTTVVAAIVLGQTLTVGWAGDSRAYWVDDTGARLLTVDHSWLQEALAAGELSAQGAHSAPQAHAITRWIGADTEAEPEVLQMELPTDGVLLLCSDGFWNYLASLEDLSALVAEGSCEAPGALAKARHLVAFANQRGGRDNITVAILQVASTHRHAESSAGIEQTTGSVRKEESEEGYAESVQG